MECVSKEKCILIDVDYCHIPQIGNVNFESEAPIVSDDHLKMGKVDPKFRIGHFSLSLFYLVLQFYLVHSSSTAQCVRGVWDVSYIRVP